jgi:hypothetical protein
MTTVKPATVSMTHDERVAAIKRVCNVIKIGDDAFDGLAKIVGCNPEAPIWTALHMAHGALVNTTAVLIGDTDEWLSWYIYENDMGAQGMKAAAASWKSMRAIKSASQLAKLIEADL